MGMIALYLLLCILAIGASGVGVSDLDDEDLVSGHEKSLPGRGQRAGEIRIWSSGGGGSKVSQLRRATTAESPVIYLARSVNLFQVSGFLVSG